MIVFIQNAKPTLKVTSTEKACNVSKRPYYFLFTRNSWYSLLSLVLKNIIFYERKLQYCEPVLGYTQAYVYNCSNNCQNTYLKGKLKSYIQFLFNSINSKQITQERIFGLHSIYSLESSMIHDQPLCTIHKPHSRAFWNKGRTTPMSLV